MSTLKRFPVQGFLIVFLVGVVVRFVTASLEVAPSWSRLGLLCSWSEWPVSRPHAGGC
ncbi:MAG: hypothetical protein PGN07_03620 [Aeromicrobium erythreum]